MTLIARTLADAHKEAIDIGARCESCALYGCGRGPVLGAVVANARLAIVGEAPGVEEVAKGLPFVGASGASLDNALLLGGVLRESVTVTNTIACRPPPGVALKDYLATVEDPAKDPVLNCSGRLAVELEYSNSSTLLAVGGQALRALTAAVGGHFGKLAKEVERLPDTIVQGIMEQHGAPIPLPDGRLLCAALHPAFAARGAFGYRHVIRDDISWAARASTLDGTATERIRAMGVAPVHGKLWPTVNEVEEFCAGLIARQNPIAEDIETDGIDYWKCRVRTVQLASTDERGHEIAMVIPIRYMDGRPYWSKWDEKRVRAAICAANDKVELIAGHNFVPFDSAVLLQEGLLSDRGRTFLDTAIIHKNTTECDLPHSLSFVVRRKLHAPGWKKEVDNKAAAGIADDGDLHKYGLTDAVYNLRILDPLMQDIETGGTSGQLSMDLSLAPVMRNMGNLGCFTDEVHRGILSTKLNKLCRAMVKKFREMIGKPDINPRSTDQIAEWLFHERGYTPAINTAGEPWKVGDPESVGAPALLRLLSDTASGGMDPKDRAAVEHLLEFRFAEATRRLHVDNLPSEPDEEVSRELVSVGAPWLGVGDGALTAPAVSVETDKGESERIEARSAMQRIRLVYKLLIATGRCSVDPNVQNVSARAWALDRDPKTGDPIPTNLRRTFCAPPGHVLVGSDMEQVELRIYADEAQDALLLEAFRGERDGYPIDPHTLNYCTMELPPDAQFADVWHRYDQLIRWKKDRGGSKEHAERLKYLRTVAKRFCYLQCLPYNTPVLTLRGLVPIEYVCVLDKVWDGVEWVAHDGVLDKGEREVIAYDGLEATPDHKVWLEESGACVSIAEAARRGDRLARSGADRQPLRFLDDRERGLAHSRAPKNLGPVQVRSDEDRLSRQPAGREVERLLLVLPNNPGLPEMAPLAALEHAEPLREPQITELQILRRARDRVSICERPGCGCLGCRNARARRESGTRPDQQQWTLRARELAVYDTTGPEQQPEQRPLPRFHLPPRGVAVYARGSDPADTERSDARGDHSGRAALCPGAPTSLGGGRRKARVYDLLNAGPRRRFTAANILVSNCYGGEEDKLFSTMSTERDKSTGKLVFPGLRPQDVEKYHKGWHKWHPETRVWQKRVISAARADGFTQSSDGRKRFWPGGLDQKNAAPNAKVQPKAAFITNRGLLAIHEEIPFGKWSRWTGLAYQIHDYVGVYVPESRAEETSKIVQRCMSYEEPGMKYPADKALATRFLSEQ